MTQQHPVLRDDVAHDLPDLSRAEAPQVLDDRAVRLPAHRDLDRFDKGPFRVCIVYVRFLERFFFGK